MHYHHLVHVCADGKKGMENQLGIRAACLWWGVEAGKPIFGVRGYWAVKICRSKGCLHHDWKLQCGDVAAMREQQPEKLHMPNRAAMSIGVCVERHACALHACTVCRLGEGQSRERGPGRGGGG